MDAPRGCTAWMFWMFRAVRTRGSARCQTFEAKRRPTTSALGPGRILGVVKAATFHGRQHPVFGFKPRVQIGKSTSNMSILIGNIYITKGTLSTCSFYKKNLGKNERDIFSANKSRLIQNLGHLELQCKDITIDMWVQ